MRNLMKFGIVLVVLAMVTSTAFADNDWEDGDSGGSWCVADNWDNGDVPSCGDGEKVRLDDDDYVVIDCTPAEAKELEMRGDSILQVGTATVHVDLTICKDLEMSDGGSSDDTTLDIVNGCVIVEDQSKDIAEDGDIHIIIGPQLSDHANSLLFDDGVYFGDSNDGKDSIYILDIAGDFEVDGDRIEHRGGQLIINLTGDGTFDISNKTARLSSDDDSVATVNISDNASFITKKLELGEKDNGAKFDYSMEVNVSGNGSWDGDNGESVKDEDDGQILNINVTGNGSVAHKDININNDDSEINITMDGGTFDISDDVDMNAGTIVITGGVFNVEDDFELGDDGVASMLVAGTADVFIDDLYMADDSALTIDGVRVDLDSLKEMGDDSVIEINGAGELVIKDADDPEDWDDIADLIDDGDIMTSDAGMVVIWDYDVTNEGRLTVRIAIPVVVDFQPGSCENPLRVNFISRGVYPVAIAGSGDFDVLDVDVDTITLEGVAVIRGAIEDVSNADDVCDLGPDTIPDLITKFSRTDLLDALEVTHGDLSELPNRAELRLNLLARTNDGTLISGSDSLLILNQGTIKRSRR